MAYTLPKEYLSASQISLLQKCGRQYELRYVEGKKSHSNINMVSGSSIHKTNEMLYTDKRNGVSPLTQKQVAELTIYNFDTIVTEEDLPPVPAKDKDIYYSDIIPVAVDYAEHIVPYITPIATELEFTYTSKCGVDILMYIDLIKQLREEDPNSRSVVDYKITGKKWSIAQLTGSIQFMLYTKALGIPNIEIHNLIRKDKRSIPKNKYTPTYEKELDISQNLKCLQMEYPPREYDHVENIIERSARQISAGVFPMADPSSWICTEKFCSYWDICRGQDPNRVIFLT